MRGIPDILYVAKYSAAERTLALTLAHNLRIRRTELGLTQEQVALAADIDRTTYQLMESARSDRATNSLLNPHLLTLLAVAEVLEISISDLIGGY